MNVLEICDDYPPFATGGVGYTVFALTQEWKKMGVNVHVLCVGSDRYPSTRSEAGVTVTRSSSPRHSATTTLVSIQEPAVVTAVPHGSGYSPRPLLALRGDGDGESHTQKTLGRDGS